MRISDWSADVCSSDLQPGLRSRGGGRALPRCHTGDDRQRPSFPRRGGDQVNVGSGKKSSWFVRGTILVVCLIWLFPALGVLVTSFRTGIDANSTGWWTTLSSPFDTAQWTFDNYVTVLTSEGFSTALLNRLALAIPPTVMPITMAAFAAYAFSWMHFRGQIGRAHV